MSPQAFLGALLLAFVSLPPAHAAPPNPDPTDVIAEEAVAVTATPNGTPEQNTGPGSAIYNPLVAGAAAPAAPIGAPTGAPAAHSDNSRTSTLLWATALAVIAAWGLLKWRARRTR